MKVGIEGYGVYIPRYRIKVHEIARMWGEDGDAMARSINVQSKSVPGLDEDVTTISFEAGRNALLRFDKDPQRIGAVYVGSESHPFAVYPTAVTVADALGITPHMTAADFEFACKAGTAAMQAVIGLVKSEEIEAGLAIGADTSQGRPNDPLEYTAGAGGAAFVIGRDKPLALLEGMYSYTTDTPDFWRREGAHYPTHGHRFTGGPAYFKHLMSAANGLMEKLGLEPSDFDRVTFHQPNGRFPLSAAKKLGFPMETISDSLAVTRIGNTYSGASIVGLARQLDYASPGERILLVSYGSGAGSDAFSFIVTDEILEKRDLAPLTDDYINREKFIDYAMYVKYRGKLILK